MDRAGKALSRFLGSLLFIVPKSGIEVDRDAEAEPGREKDQSARRGLAAWLVDRLSGSNCAVGVDGFDDILSRAGRG